MKLLITGITGFVGSHMAEHCLSFGSNKVYGTKRYRSPLDNISTIIDKIELFDCDLMDYNDTLVMLDKLKPDIIFHLAAQSYVPESFHAPSKTINTNVTMQLNIFEACRTLNIKPVIQIACSSEEYGLVYKNELPIKETNALRPLSPYGVSKVAQDMLGYQYYKSYGLPIVRTRAFNHTGARRGKDFVESNFAYQFGRIKLNLQDNIIKVGNLDAKRDFTDVRDIVNGYWLAATHKNISYGEVYNLCSGRSIYIGNIIDFLQDITNIKVKIEIDESRLRPSDVQILEGDYYKLNILTGWSPNYELRDTFNDLYNYWIDKLKLTYV